MGKCPITDYNPPEYCDNKDCYFVLSHGCSIKLAAKTSCENQDEIRSLKRELEEIKKKIK